MQLRNPVRWSRVSLGIICVSAMCMDWLCVYADENRHIDSSTPRLCALSAHVALLSGDEQSFRGLLSQTIEEDPIALKIFIENHQALSRFEQALDARYGRLAHPILERLGREPRMSRHEGPLLSISEMIITGELRQDKDTATIQLMAGEPRPVRMQREGENREWRITDWAVPGPILLEILMNNDIIEEYLSRIEKGKYTDVIAMLSDASDVFTKIRVGRPPAIPREVFRGKK